MLLATSNFKMALATYIFKIILLFQQGEVFSQDLAPREATPIASRFKREVPVDYDPAMWYLNSRCEVKCKADLTPRSKCYIPPSVKWFCEYLDNEHWCCRQFQYNSLSISFRKDCTPVCGPHNRPCTSSRCAICSKMNFKPSRCCGGCSKPKPLPVPTEDSGIALAASGEPVEMCPEVPDNPCQIFDGRPDECRTAKDCAYNCATGTCETKENAEGECFNSCFNHCHSRCGCITSMGCTYDPVTGKCQPQTERYCRLSYFPDKECARKGGFYSVGGVLCQSLFDKGNCELNYTVVAVNLGTETVVKDSQDIEYQGQSSVPRLDPMSIAKDIAFTPADIVTPRAEDGELLSTAITTIDTVCENQTRECVDFILPTMDLDGNYELGIRTVEGVHDVFGVRHFSIIFANVEIFTEVDIIGLTEAKFKPLNLLVNFKVENKGRTLILKGHNPMPMGPNTVLSLCRGECGVDPSFLVSAFHIIHQKPFIKEQVDPCTVSTVEACDEGKFGATECRKQDSIYAIDGKYCKMGSSGGECTIGEIIKAVNFNGPPLDDSRAIAYVSGSKKQLTEAVPGMTLMRGPNEPIDGASPDEQTLYGNIIYGDESIDHPHACVSVKLPVCEDAKHELAIRVADDEADVPNYRRFTISIQDHPIFEEIDIYVLAGNQKSKAVDLVFNFEVINKVTKIKFKNLPVDMELPISDEKEIILSFCYSKCTQEPVPMKKGFIVGGISLIKFGEEAVPNPTCDGIGSDACACRFEGCEYNADKEKCVGKPKECPINCAARETKQCRRGLPNGHYYYAVGGVVCHSQVETGDCADPEKIMAVNYGGEAHVDIHGIMFDKDDGIPFDDPDNTKVISDQPSPNMMAGIPPADLTLYNLYIYGDNTKGKTCLTYSLPTAGDGFYELSIKTGETYRDGFRQRAFSYKLNDQYIVQEFEPARHRFPPYAFDLNVNLMVLDVSSKMQMEGHQPSDILTPDKTLPLSFCFGTCTWDEVDPNWLIGAFSLLKFRAPLPCNQHNNNPCACRHDEDCELEAGGRCVDKEAVCNITAIPGDECRRGGEHIFYLDNGVICQHKIGSGKCEISKQLIAVNLNGILHQDIYGIVFSKGSDVPYDDPRSTSTSGTTIFQGVPVADIELYQTYIYGDQTKANDTCITFELPTDGDGRYELSMKNGDIGSKRRGFNILLNGESLAEHFEVAKVRKAPDAFDLNVPFKISGGGNTLELSGHSPSTISSVNLTMPLQFCFGACVWPDADIFWSTSGFSVVKFNDGKQCNESSNDPCACRQMGHCGYNPGTGECVSRPDACAKPTPTDANECRRAGAHIFYADRGVVCISTIDSGDCDTDIVVVAHNLNGVPLMDSQGIGFQDDSTVDYEDASGTVEKHDTTGNTDYAQSGVPVVDKNLHGTFWYGNSLTDYEACTTFHIPLAGDGYYELSMKTGEPFHDKIAQRSFNILLNGQYVVQEFDPNQIRLAPNGFDLNVYYKVTGSETKFQMTGHPEIDITTTDSTIPLKFCFGTCNFMDSNWFLGAFSVVKLKGKLPCENYNGDVCSCRYNDCEYNVDTDECLDRAKACDYHFTGKDCRRGGDHVFQVKGGVICHNPVEYGSCHYMSNILSITFGDGTALTVVNDIVFQTELGLGHQDPGRSRQPANATVPVQGVPPGDEELYQNYIYGDSNSATDVGKCLTYNVSLPLADADYEISIKIAEFQYAQLKKRAFSILFNKKYILREVEPARYRFTPFGIHFNINFKFYGKKFVQLEGYSASEAPADREVPLDFCFGTCTWPEVDINWFVMAVSVIKLAPSCDDQGKHANPCTCLRNGGEECDYKVNEDSQQCSFRNIECYNIPSLPNECRRGGDHTFYVHDGIVCNLVDAGGNCKLGKVMLAVNFGDGAQDITDINGITFQKDSGVPHDDPDGNKVEGKSAAPVEGVPASDENLYSTFIYGNKSDSANCVTYHVPTDGDGEYELNIRTGEVLGENNPRRDIVFKFNGLYIVRLFNPVKYKPKQYGFDLIANFRVSQSGSKMAMRGHTDSDISTADQKIPLEFCYGGCNFNRLQKMWYISAFSVVKFDT